MCRLRCPSFCFECKQTHVQFTYGLILGGFIQNLVLHCTFCCWLLLLFAALLAVCTYDGTLFVLQNEETVVLLASWNTWKHVCHTHTYVWCTGILIIFIFHLVFFDIVSFPLFSTRIHVKTLRCLDKWSERFPWMSGNIVNRLTQTEHHSY